jgi:hypothetical protein
VDPLLYDALKDGSGAFTHLVTATLRTGGVVRWLLGGGFVIWDGETYEAKDETYGSLSSISELEDGVGDDGAPVEVVIQPPSLASLEDLSAADLQGSKVTIHLAAVDEATGLLIGEPYRLHVGYLDRPAYGVGRRRLVYEILTAEALALEPNEEQRQSDAFHQDIWPGERGYEYQTDGTKIVFWREDDPNNAIGFISPKKKKGGDPLEFTYDVDAGWPFPFGRTNVAGTINGRFGFGPTNRYNVIFATVAASGPIQGFDSFIANDEVTNFGAGDAATDGEHAGAMWLQRKVGAQPQTALSTPAGIGEAPSEWSSAHGMSGKACYALTMFENSKKNEFSGGVPTIQNVVEGLLGYDPTDPDSEADDPTTWTQINDGVTAALNWAMGRWEGPVGDGRHGVPGLTKLVGGYGAALDAIDVAGHAAAIEMATGYGWKVSDVPTSAEDKHAVRKRLLQAAGCEPARVCGMIGLVCNAAPVESLFDVSNADTAGDFSIALQASRLERRNVSLPKFKSEAHRWEMTALRPIGDPDWITTDGGRRATGPSYPTVPDKDQAAALAYLDLAHDRALQGEAPFRAHMMAVEPGQGFTWQEPEFLMVGVKVQVRKRSYDPMTGVVKIAFRAERDEDYVEALAQVGVTPPPSSGYSPPPAYVEGPSLFAVEAEGGTVHVSWRNPTGDIDFAWVQILRNDIGSTSFIDAVPVGPDHYGALGDLMLWDDVPGSSGTYVYWAVAYRSDLTASLPEGPLSVTL